ncbi:RNA polymerase factor sigma-54 [Caldisalinibacter kiritimatiensis]|uniref:RNA polymerase sigma-54 factor RpoN n=1 Tax=Caldisalinibacter kiritimatiensis TaxID=1304284 RepID=R1AR40_9FIRM|nr:RNA polymerase factor sigma-54 [Caldisalinibacter kiritimatiensis]EOC99612.1 RNA polymerase sigma-54 factor RpoN [Caldisalinibacter kiritimatiensis]
MKLGFDLNLEQTQKLVMTPELRQAIQILQFSNQELQEFIEQRIEENPLLEVETINKKEENIDEINDKIEDIDWKEYFEQYDDISYRQPKNSDEKKESFESFVKVKTTLKDHLLFQLNMSIFDERYKNIGEVIIDSIDKNGYLITSIEEIGKQLGVPYDEVEKVLQIIQSFDPVGVGARNLKECLTIQLKSRRIEDKIPYLVVERHLEDIGNNRIMKLAKKLSISKKKAQEICDLIKSLEPKPGRGFSHESDNIRYITPDVILEYIDGEYVIIVNDVTAPRLMVSKYYKELLKKAKDQNISKFLTEKLNSSMWVIKSIEQRRMTIYKVAKSIVKFQQDFFEKGNKALKPLVLKDIAEDIGVHESTVSRAVNGKYMQTPRGLFELKYFFSSGLSSRSGEVSSTSIKSMIKELIDNENPKKPLSDQKIANILKEKNIKISRRTVAKYRDEMNIPSSSGRRRY